MSNKEEVLRWEKVGAGGGLVHASAVEVFFAEIGTLAVAADRVGVMVGPSPEDMFEEGPLPADDPGVRDGRIAWASSALASPDGCAVEGGAVPGAGGNECNGFCGAGSASRGAHVGDEGMIFQGDAFAVGV